MKAINLEYSHSYFSAHQDFINNKPDHGFSFQSVDQLKDVRFSTHLLTVQLFPRTCSNVFSWTQFLLEDDEDADVSECEQCVQLVKAMLTIDGADRITPKDILSHSFISRTSPPASPTTGSRGDDSQVDQLFSTGPLGEEVKTLKERDDGDVKIH